MMNRVAYWGSVVGALFASAACGSSSAGEGTSTGGMNATAGSSPVAGADGGAINSSGGRNAAGGEATSGGGPDNAVRDPGSLVGSWQLTSEQPLFAIVVKFMSDGSYETNVVTFPTASLWQDQIERGTYATSGSTLTLTPTQWSCPGPDPVSPYQFSFSNGNLVLTNAKSALVYPPQAMPDQGVPPNVIVTIGCYDANGVFTAMALAPVGN